MTRACGKMYCRWINSGTSILVHICLIDVAAYIVVGSIPAATPEGGYVYVWEQKSPLVLIITVLSHNSLPAWNKSSHLSHHVLQFLKFLLALKGFNSSLYGEEKGGTVNLWWCWNVAAFFFPFGQPVGTLVYFLDITSVSMYLNHSSCCYSPSCCCSEGMHSGKTPSDTHSRVMNLISLYN